MENMFAAIGTCVAMYVRCRSPNFCKLDLFWLNLADYLILSASTCVFIYLMNESWWYEWFFMAHFILHNESSCSGVEKYDIGVFA